MAGFQNDVKKYESLIKNDLLKLRGQSDRVVTEIQRGNPQYKANVMLWIACARPYIPVEYCEMLIVSFGADPNYVANNDAQTSCLMVASASPDAKKVQLLLERGANPNYQSTTTMNTALLIAVMNKQALNVRMLLFAGADPNAVIKVNDGKTVLDYAREIDGETGEKIVEALIKLPDEVSVTMTLFLENESLNFQNHPLTDSYENIESLYEYIGNPDDEDDEDDAGDAAGYVGFGGSSRKRKRTNKRRKTNKKRRTNKKRKLNKKRRTNRRK